MFIKKSNSNQIDMLNGSLLEKILLFAIPIALSSILQQLFNSVDVAVIGKFASSQEQAAVGSNGPLINLFLNLFVGLSVGTNVLISNYIGQGQKNRIKDTVHTSIVVAIVSGILLIFLGILLSPVILRIIDTPNDVLDHAILYLRIYFIGMPFILIYNFSAAILRSIGDTKRPLYCLIFSGIVNAVLNMILVIVFHMGVSGVGIATVISNMISASMVLYFLLHEEEPLKLSIRKLRISAYELKRMMQIGIPAGLQNMVFSFSNVCIQSVLNGYGSDAVAGSAITLNFEYVTYFITVAFTQAAVTFTSQNYGAGNYSRCRKVFRLSMICSMLCTGSLSLSFVLGRNFFISLFTSVPIVAEYAIVRMIYILTLNFLASSYEISGAVLRGIGYSITPAILTIFGVCVFRLGWIYLVCPRFPAFEVLLLVYPISWIITGFAVLSAYFILRKKAFRMAA